ncbi:WcaA Glycosyltransferases involved in cell wall biogenesis [Candidatus Pelagibacterales bacterium]
MFKKNRKNLVSIITPAYNAEDTIERCIKSVLSQSYKNYEHIVINDCSTDKTKKKLISFKKKFNLNKLKIINNQTNKGPAKSRIDGLRKSKGSYISFLDADDKWNKNKLYLQIKFMQDKNILFSYTNIIKNFKKKFIFIKMPEKIDYEELLKTNYIFTSSVMLKRKIFKKVLPKDIYYDDYALWLDILKKKNTAFLSCKKFLTIYYVQKLSVSSNKIESLIKVAEVFKAIGYKSKLNRIILILKYIFYTIKRKISENFNYG